MLSKGYAIHLVRDFFLSLSHSSVPAPSPRIGRVTVLCDEGTYAAAFFSYFCIIISLGHIMHIIVYLSTG